jgi:trimeric autotransporter adhesin
VPTAPAAAPSRGAAAVGSLSYPVPAGALFVSSSAGSDSGSGSASAPLRTVARAVSLAVSGQTIVLRGGSYHERVEIPVSKRLTIQPYPNETVWFDGSRPVTDWTPSGSVWVAPWTIEFAHNVSFSAGSHDPSWLTSEFPMAGHPDQVFIDGVALQQVASAGQVRSGTFYVDDAGDRLLIGNDPRGRSVRASDLDKAFNIYGHGSTLQGIGIQRYATPISALGTVRIAGDDITVRQLTVRDNASLGISMRGNRGLVDRVTVVRSGLLGIHANNADGVRVLNSITNDNNTEHFKPAPTASGLKITKSRNIVLDNNQATANDGFGLWLDMSVVGFTITDNTATDNTAAGIVAELSQTGIIAGNISINNKEGIWVYDTGNVKIYNNLAAGSEIQDLILKQDQRRPATWTYGGQDTRWPNYLTDAPWLTRDIIVTNNIFANGGRFHAWAQDVTGSIDADDMNITVTANYFSKRATTSDPRLLMWGNAGGTTLTSFDTVAAMRAYEPGWNNIEAPGSYTPDQMRSTAPHQSAAALPSDVAAALGQPVGTRRMGPFQSS